MMETNSRRLLARLKADAFIIVKVRGSHHKLKKDGLTVTLPHPKKDLPLGTVRNIYKQAGWPLD